MATKTLIEKIEALPPEKRSEVERYVDALVAPSDSKGKEPGPPKPSRDELFQRIHERRERLRREHGLFPDSTAIIRELRESGS